MLPLMSPLQVPPLTLFDARAPVPRGNPAKTAPPPGAYAKKQAGSHRGGLTMAFRSPAHGTATNFTVSIPLRCL